MPQPAATQELAGALADVVRGALGTPVQIEDLRRLSAGASRQTYSFDAVADDQRQRLILQRDAGPGGGISLGGNLERDATVLRVAAEVGVPVPHVVASGSCAEGPLSTSYVITRRLEGEALPQRLLRDDRYRDARRALPTQLGQALGRIHQIDPTVVPGLQPLEPLDNERAVLDQLGWPSPAFELGLRWLDARRPATTATTLVHGDFRNGNFLVDESGLVAVLDWEIVHFGDPLEDLGWLCVRAWRFGSDQPAGGFGSREELYAAYEATTGAVVDRQAAHWWEVYGTLRWGVMCMMQAARHLLGSTRSVELATIGRRVAEQEHDLLELIQ